MKFLEQTAKVITDRFNSWGFFSEDKLKSLQNMVERELAEVVLATNNSVDITNEAIEILKKLER